MKRFSVLSFIFLGVALTLSGQSIAPRTLLVNMISSINQTKTMTFEFLGKERWGDKWISKRNLFKIQNYPRKIYLKDLDSGMELLYANGWNNGKVLANPNGFPYINVSLSPTSERVRQDQHHTLFEAGFAFMGETMTNILKRIDNEKMDLNKVFKLNADITFNGRPCYNLDILYSEFTYKDFTLTKSETPRQIGLRLLVNEQMILNANGLTSHGELPAGKTIKVPTAYCPKVTLYIDKEYLLPVVQKVYDEKGLLEHYEYSKLKVNPVFAQDEFSTDFQGYGF